MSIQVSKSISFSKIYSFLWQHLWLLISLYIMTLGVALCIRSNLGSSVISSLPMSFALAGADGLVAPLSIGGYTNIMNVILVGCQILVLRRRFEAVQLLQLVIGFLFGALIDINMWLTSSMVYSDLLSQVLLQGGGCTVMAIGIALEVRCGSVTMPGEGIQVAVSRVSGQPFAKVKIYIDTLLVGLAIGSCFLFWKQWQWNIIGPGTLFAMIYVGMAVKFLNRYLGWFDRLLDYRPGFRRYLYGLAKYLYNHKHQ